MKEEGEELTLEKEEEFLSEMYAVAVLEILVEEVKTQVLVNQVLIELTNQRFNAITVKNMDIMHMSAGRDSIIRTSKVKINQTTQITKLTLCLWSAL
jgi:hypothetical protein